MTSKWEVDIGGPALSVVMRLDSLTQGKIKPALPVFVLTVLVSPMLLSDTRHAQLQVPSGLRQPGCFGRQVR